MLVWKMVAKDKLGGTKNVNRGAWTADEDEKLSQYIKAHGESRWRLVPSRAGLNRCGRSCRLRWLNYLRPNIKRGNISDQEEDLIIRLHKLLGNRWSLIARRLPGRTDNEIKNYWNTHFRKKLKLTQHIAKEAANNPNSRDEANTNSDKLYSSVSEADEQEPHKGIEMNEFNVGQFFSTSDDQSISSFLNSNIIKPMGDVEKQIQTACGDNNNNININPQTDYKWRSCTDQCDDNPLCLPWLTENLDHDDYYWDVLFSNNASTAEEKVEEELDLFLL